MPRGGRRVGAGRKPLGGAERFVRNSRNSAPPAAPGSGGAGPIAAVKQSVLPPDELATRELTVWHQFAPLAIAAGTLVPATVPAFSQLCELEADRRELRARFTRRDRPLLTVSENEMAMRREVRALTLAVRAGLKDFCISPFGKELLAPGGAGGAEDDPLERFFQR